MWYMALSVLARKYRWDWLELRKRVQQHFLTISLAKRDSQQGNILTTVASHYLLHHGRKCGDTKIVGLDHLRSSFRGGDMTPTLLQSECRWIFKLNQWHQQVLSRIYCIQDFSRNNSTSSYMSIIVLAVWHHSWDENTLGSLFLGSHLLGHFLILLYLSFGHIFIFHADNFGE